MVTSISFNASLSFNALAPVEDAIATYLMSEPSNLSLTSPISASVFSMPGFSK